MTLHPAALYVPPMTKRSEPHGDFMRGTTDLSSIRLHDVETNPMSTLSHRTGTARRWSGLPLTRASSSYFLLGQNAQGLWVIRENTGKKAGIFKSREAALRFARMESPDGLFAVVHVNDPVELDYAAQHL
jgi:hypothetical protein